MKSAATESLEADIRTVLNKHSAESGSDTPDFILASYLMAALGTFNAAVRVRDRWYRPDAEQKPEVLES